MRLSQRYSTEVRQYSTRTRVYVLGLELGPVHILMEDWDWDWNSNPEPSRDSMFTNVQQTFSIYILPPYFPTTSVSVFMAGYKLESVALSGLHMSPTDIEVIRCICNSAPCKLNTCLAVNERSCGHTRHDSRTKFLVLIWFSLH